MAAKKELEMEGRMSRMEQSLSDVKDDVGEIKKTLNDFIKSADDKYASRSVVKMVYAIYGALAIAFLGIITFLLESHFK